jgi:glyoxylase-like metal-dependent hydrolase (beta-lactamase superfamily II)
VDTGIGHKGTEKFRRMYAADDSSFSLSDSLEKLNLAPGDITDVILTHLHFDHTGGATRLDDDGRAVPTFPGATYYVQKKQYEWARSPSERDRASFFPENYEPLKEHGCLEILNGEREFVPGVSVVVVNGHTPGQQLVKVASGAETLFFSGDLFPTPSHIPLPWIMSFDLEPLVTLEDKKRILPTAVAENWIFFYEHDPKIIASRVKETRNGYAAGDTVLALEN